MIRQGIQIFDENSNCTLDTNNRICKFLGIVETGYEDGFVVDDRLEEGNFWVMDIEIKLSKNYDSRGRIGGMPHFTCKENKLIWTFAQTDKKGKGDISRKVLYGVY